MGSVLVVDDDADTADAMRRLLTQGGHRAESVEGGSEALSWLAGHSQEPPDVIVLDWMMPLVGGADVLRTIRADPAYRNVRVLIFSAAYESELVRTAKVLGADDYIGKGTVAPAELVKRIEALMNHAAPGEGAAAAPTTGPRHDLAADGVRGA